MTSLYEIEHIPEDLGTSPEIVTEYLPCMDRSADFFQNNLQHVEYLVMEARSWVATAFLRIRNMKSVNPKDLELSFLQLPPDVTTPDKAKQWCMRLHKRRQDMEAESALQGVELNFPTLRKQYALDEFESRVIQFLFAVETSMEFSGLLEECHVDAWESSRDDINVATVLSILTEGYAEQIEKRRYFSVFSPLVREEIVRLSGWSRSRIVDTEIMLHSRISNFIIGDNNIYDVGMQCFSSETPNIKLESVVMDIDTREDLVKYAESFLVESEQRQAIADSFQYGTALTCLFHGPSGTGKTMLANAIATHLGCSIFNLNIGELDHLDISFARALKAVFREARLAGGIVFLDECDDVLQDSSPMSRTFLIEIEKAHCITILATNRTVKLDPAMERRINLKIPFRLPDAEDRRRIWEALLPEGAEYAQDIDLDDLASRYQFTGGLIKNTLVMAASRISLAQASRTGKIILNAEAIHNAAEYQAKSMFDTAGVVMIPDRKISTLPVRSKERELLERISTIVIDSHRRQHGFSMLLSSMDLETGRLCVEAILAKAGFVMRQFSDKEIFSEKNNSRQNLLFDPLTQQQISVTDYVFSNREGMQQASLIMDRTGIFRRYFAKKDDSEDTAIATFIEHVEKSGGIVFLVTSLEENSQVPLAFSYSMSLGYPPEEQQMKSWERKFPSLQEADIITLVEKFPMHMKEIQTVSDRITTAAKLEEKAVAAISVSDIEKFIGRLRNRRNIPLLFGF